MKDKSSPKQNSLEEQLCNNGLDSYEEDTGHQSIDSNVYTFNDVVQEEVVSSEVISNSNGEEYITAQNDSLSQIINDTIGSSTLNNSIENSVENNIIMNVDGSMDDSSRIFEKNCQ